MVEAAETLILGAKGMLGHALMDVFPTAIFYDKQELDITNKQAVMKAISSLKPKLVINAAAYTDVDACESNKELAMKVNGNAAGFIADACEKAGASMVHYSTDYVFDGSKEGFQESDQRKPINVYGESKALGEELIEKSGASFYLLRTSWLFGPNGKNFVKTIATLAKEKPELQVVSDQKGCPTYTKDLAARTKELILSYPPGVYHTTNSGACTWFELAWEIVSLSGSKAKVIPTTSDAYKRAARRPANSILLNTKLEPLRPWRDALKAYLEGPL